LVVVKRDPVQQPGQPACRDVRTLEQSIPASFGLAIFFVLANVVHPTYSLRQHRGQGYTEVRRQTLVGLFEHVRFWLTKPPMTGRRDVNYNPALDRAPS
jgi:hypothetical protein